MVNTLCWPALCYNAWYKIGKGSIVSAYSMVKGDFPEFSIIAGNPAKVVGNTRNIDGPFLQANPELRTFYEEWAK